MPPTDSQEALLSLEQEFQGVLADWPPPLFVQRQLSTTEIPQAERPGLYRRLFPTAQVDDSFVQIWSLADGQACSGRDDIACLNRFFHAEVGERLEALAERSKALTETMAATGEDARQTAAELEIAILVELCDWHFITQPLAVYRPDAALFARARALLRSNLVYWRGTRRWLPWQRCASSGARLRFLEQDRNPNLIWDFDHALALAHHCIQAGVALDADFPRRFDELIHQAGLVKAFHRDPAYLNLCAFVKLPERIKPAPGTMRFTVEDDRLIGNMSAPLEMALGDRLSEYLPGRLLVDFLGVADRAIVTMLARRGRGASMLQYSDLQRQGRLDLLMRPNYFDVTLQKGGRPLSDKPGASDEVFLMSPDTLGPDPPDHSRVLTDRRWRLSFPVEHLGFDAGQRPVREEREIGLSGMHWEAHVGALLEDILSQADDPALGHVVLSPDGPLTLLPLHLAQLRDGSLLCDRVAVSYTPALTHFRPGPESGVNAQVVMLLNSANLLEGPPWEAERMRRRLGSRLTVLDGFRGSPNELADTLRDADILHCATHGHAFADTPDASGLELAPGHVLTLRDIEQLNLKPGSLVFLNACSSNKVAIRSRIQFSSIAAAFLGAGAGTVIGTFWEAKDLAAALISDRFYSLYASGDVGRLEALRQAVDWLRTLPVESLAELELGELDLYVPFGAVPFAHPDHWGPFALFGAW